MFPTPPHANRPQTWSQVPHGVTQPYLPAETYSRMAPLPVTGSLPASLLGTFPASFPMPDSLPGPSAATAAAAKPVKAHVESVPSAHYTFHPPHPDQSRFNNSSNDYNSYNNKNVAAPAFASSSTLASASAPASASASPSATAAAPALAALALAVSASAAAPAPATAPASATATAPAAAPASSTAHATTAPDATDATDATAPIAPASDAPDTRNRPSKRPRILAAPPPSVPSPMAFHLPGHVDQLPDPREVRNAPYATARFEAVLRASGVLLGPSPRGGPARESEAFIRRALDRWRPARPDTVFDPTVFDAALDRLGSVSEARVKLDLGRLIVPSAERLGFESKVYAMYCETVEELWANSMPLTSPCPRPDFSVGFRWDAFTAAQRAKLAPFVGSAAGGDRSLFAATWQMAFPFLTCEVKAADTSLDVADRQNAHSVALAVRAVVTLFGLVGRASEIDRQIVAYSISHSNRSVRIYGYYPEIDDDADGGSSDSGPNSAAPSFRCYRYPIRDLSITDRGGEERWASFDLITCIYRGWGRRHFERIVSAIDLLPDPNSSAANIYNAGSPPGRRPLVGPVGVPRGGGSLSGPIGPPPAGPPPALPAMPRAPAVAGTYREPAWVLAPLASSVGALESPVYRPDEPDWMDSTSSSEDERPLTAGSNRSVKEIDKEKVKAEPESAQEPEPETEQEPKPGEW